MYVQIPNFVGFNGVGILPHSDAQGGCFVLGDPAEMFICEQSSTYVPFFPGHYYFLYRSKRMNGRSVNYFENEDAMNAFLIGSFGKLPVVSHFLNVSVGNEWVPHLTPLVTTIDMRHISDSAPSPCTASDSLDVCSNLLDVILSSAVVDKDEICINILDDVLESVTWKSENRCNLCFVSHFPWMKVCRRVKGKNNNLLKSEIPVTNVNDDAVEINQKELVVDETVQTECLKLRGGASGPKYLSIDYDKVGKLLTIFLEEKFLSPLLDPS